MRTDDAEWAARTESSYVDKSAWYRGEWDNEPDRVEWRYHGTPRFPLLIVRGPSGQRLRQRRRHCCAQHAEASIVTPRELAEQKGRDHVTSRAHGWIRFNEGDERWSMPDPTDGARCDAAHAARYSLKNMTQTQAYQLAEVYEAYHHLMTHPSGTEYAVGQLRAMRRAIRKGGTDG